MPRIHTRLMSRPKSFVRTCAVTEITDQPGARSTQRKCKVLLKGKAIAKHTQSMVTRQTLRKENCEYVSKPCDSIIAG